MNDFQISVSVEVVREGTSVCMHNCVHPAVHCQAHMVGCQTNIWAHTIVSAGIETQNLTE